MAEKRTQNNGSKQHSLDVARGTTRKRISNAELVRIGKDNLTKITPITPEYRFEEEKSEGVEMLEKIIIMSDNISDIT